MMFQLRLLVVLLICTFCNEMASAQILKRVLRESQRKIEREVENMVVEKVSDIIVRKATQSIESAFDKMIEDQMKADSNYVNRTDQPDSIYYRSGQKYAAFLAGLNEAAELPAQYNFDLSLLIETVDQDGKESEMRMYYSKTEAIMGIEQFGENEGSFMVMDMEKDIMAMYQEKKGKKTVQAIPNMMGMAGAMAANEEMVTFEFKSTGKTKKVAGYNCQEYRSETKDDNMSTWVSTEVPVNWKDTYGKMIQKVAPAAYLQGMDKMEGMALETQTTEKKKPYKEYTFTTKEVSLTPFVLDNSQYEKNSAYGN